MNETKKWFLVFVVLFALGTITNCSMTERTVVSAADVVNEVARKGDQIDAITVETCHEAESAAAELPDLEMAEAKVKAIRQRCDEVIESIDKLEEAIEQVDLVFEAVERGDAEVEDLVSAAIGARQAFERAKGANEELKAYLEHL